MGLRAVGPDRLALALPQPQRIDDRGAEQEDQHRRGYQRPAGAEGDVAEDVEDRGVASELREKGEHSASPGALTRALRSRPAPETCSSAHRPAWRSRHPSMI